MGLRLIRWLSSTTPLPFPKPPAKPDQPVPEWQKRDASIKKRYGQWNPTRKLTRDQMDDVKNIAAQMPHLRTVDLAQYFNVLPEAIRRILKSKWQPLERTGLALREREQRRRDAKKALTSLSDEGRSGKPQSVHIEDLMAALENPSHKPASLLRKPRSKRTKGKSAAPVSLSLGDYID